MNIKINDKPYWAKFYELEKERANAESDARNAENLYDAIIAGFNMTYLDGEMAGYLGEDGEIELYGKYEHYTEEQLKAVKVDWAEFDYDADGYPVVYFRTVEGE